MQKHENFIVGQECREVTLAWSYSYNDNFRDGSVYFFSAFRWKSWLSLFLWKWPCIS